MYSAPSDTLAQKVVDLITYPTESRDRLCAGAYITNEPTNPLGQLQAALEATEAASPLEAKIREAKRTGIISARTELGEIEAAEDAGILTGEEAQQLRDLDAEVMALIAVDDFDPEELVGRKAG